jgi:hypothetical protein
MVIDLCNCFADTDGASGKRQCQGTSILISWVFDQEVPPTCSGCLLYLWQKLVVLSLASHKA